MIRIRRVHSTVLPADRERVEQVQGIFRRNFSAIVGQADKIPDQLNQPFRYGYRTVLLVSETALGNVTGFSLFMHLPEINSSLLDFLAVDPDRKGRGLGSSLFEATREYLQSMKSRGLYMEVLPDDPRAVSDPVLLEENSRRLEFYERFGIRPIVGTEYETPIGKAPAPYLLFDGLGRAEPLRRSEARAGVRLILTRKYSHLLPPDYIERVIESFVNDPVAFREPRYLKAAKAWAPVKAGRLLEPFTLVMGPKHHVHHVRDQGYFERPARIDAIRESLAPLPWFAEKKVQPFPESHITAVHDTEYVNYLKAVCEKLGAERPVYPYVFPIRRPERRPKDLAVRAGYYCIDTFTPLDHNAYTAARDAVNAALTGAAEVAGGRRVTYVLCRPPGHHAERRVFGGFCYFNNASVAANFLSATGTVAVLDLDYHHGNGTQDIFYHRRDVLTLSIHGHPNVAYPYFSGFADETGTDEGTGFNRNYPLAETAGEPEYLAALDKAVNRIVNFKPTFLVVSLGFDTIRGDPTGTFQLRASCMSEIAKRIGCLGLPLLIVQEGGYNLRNLRRGVVEFFTGLQAVLAEVL